MEAKDKIFTYLKKTLDESIAEGYGTTKAFIISDKTPRGSFDWLKIAWEYWWGGSYQPHFVENGITVDELYQAKAQGLLKYRYSSSWTALRLRQTDYWCLTIKGLKEFYKTYKDECKR